MRIAVAGNTGWRLRIPGSRRLSMDALVEVFRLLGVATLTLRQRNLSARDLMPIAVAGLTGLIAKHPVYAAREMFGFLIMAGQTLNLRHFGGMRIVLDRPMAIRARENAVNARGMLAWVNGNALAAV